MFRALALMVVAFASLCAAAGGRPARGDGSDSGQRPARNFEVRMKSTKFDQKEITVSVGDTVRWVNEDDGPHSVTADAGSAVSVKEMIVEGGTFTDRVTFDKEGVLNYHCKFHGSMKGSVTVKK